MCGGSLAGSLLFLPLDYGYTAGVIMHGAWPFAGAALWLATWSYAPSLGMVFPAITLRFPDGKVPARWQFVDLLAVLGTVAFIVGVALASVNTLAFFIPLAGGRTFHAIAALMWSPFGGLVPDQLLAASRLVSLALVLLAFVGCVASVIDRLRQAQGDARLQLKWFTYSGVVVAVALVVGMTWTVINGGLDQVVLGRHLGDALIPVAYATLTLPAALSIAILRYRLYDIDLIINRTLVYGSLTAILGAVYAAAVTLLNRLFISVSGQKSDAAYVVTAFVVVVASSPIKDWLQRQVDRRTGMRPCC